MKFPITRESLQALTLEQLKEAEQEEKIQKKLDECVWYLCTEFKRYVPSNLEKKQFIWIGLHLIPSSPTETYLQQFINKVQEQFIDCYVKTDTERRYILIDWS
jgi:hypothetical protein